MIAFLDTLPNVELAFAYGSGAFHQPKLYTSRDALPLLDFILAVRDPLEWHAQNLSTNPTHYSGLAKYGPKWIEFISSRIGVGLHFNTYVLYKDRFVKYGVIGLEAMKSDLLTWRNLYISGRLHKPVHWIKHSQELTKELKSNNQAAFAAALILSPQSFNRKELYQLVCQLSYSGDIRMRFAEDKSKIQRIVDGSFAHFETLYNSNLVSEITTEIQLEEDHTSTLHINPSKQLNLLPFLPQSVRDGLVVKGQSLSSLQTNLQSILSQRVSQSSRRQAIAGLLGIGLSKGVWYLKEKMKKSWTSTLIKNLNS